MSAGSPSDPRDLLRERPSCPRNATSASPAASLVPTGARRTARFEKPSGPPARSVAANRYEEAR